MFVSKICANGERIGFLVSILIAQEKLAVAWIGELAAQHTDESLAAKLIDEKVKDFQRAASIETKVICGAELKFLALLIRIFGLAKSPIPNFVGIFHIDRALGTE